MAEIVDSTFNPIKQKAVNNVKAIMAVVEQATSLTVPQALDYKDLWIKKVTLHASPQQLIQQEKLALPTEPLLIHQALRTAGFPQTFLDVQHFKVSMNNPFFTNYETGEFHTLEALARGLTEDNTDNQLRIGVMLGFQFIESHVRSIAHRLNPSIQGDERNDYWRLMMRQSLVDFAQTGRSRFKDKKAYQGFKDRVNYLFSEQGLKSENGVIEAVGASVVCRFPGQSRINPEIRIGGIFHEGTVRSLTSGAKTRFATLFYEGGSFEVSDEVEKKMSALIEITEIQSKAEAIHQILDSEGDIVEAFFSSKLPRLYNESEDPRINPFNYAQIVDQSDWLRR